MLFPSFIKRSLTIFSFCCISQTFAQTKIDRKALVERHTIINNKFDSLSSLSVGNGGFAFTVDVTGMQSFPDAYAKGVPLGTQSTWGWHSFVDTANYQFSETLKDYQQAGRKISYSVQIKEPERRKNAVNWFRQNPHRLQLGNLGFVILKKDGSEAGINDIKNFQQSLNMFTGEIISKFTVEDIPVEVHTFCHQRQDAIAVKIISLLLQQQRIKLKLVFPYPTDSFKDVAVNYSHAEKHQSSFRQPDGKTVFFDHVLDSTKYEVLITSAKSMIIKEKENHYFLVEPKTTLDNTAEFTCYFLGAYHSMIHSPSFSEVKTNSESSWKKFWQSGAAIDFEGSTDARAFELERRIILSQYLTKIQCSNQYPPQETGLTYNSWYGKPHLEMHWWHAYHYALWGRIELLEKSLAWYKRVYNNAKAIAQRQGYEGVRWQKMTDNEGRETPSSIGALLIWQQPHVITFAELCYRNYDNKETLEKYKDLVFATADFMASFAYYDSADGKYILGKGVIPAQERFKAEETFNPTYELVYWHWALEVAQQWRVRLKLPRNKKWDDVLQKLSPLPVQKDKYLFTESATDSYTNPEFRTDHPAVFGALGMLPQSNWSWDKTWGWDFPLTAMTATRLGLPDKAIDALLMPIKTNTYLNNGHNYQDDRLTIYLPGNGGLLTAVAMMCAGYDGCKTSNPGIPKNGKWKVRWEGLRKMP
jgi:hypothetical protein